jgi:ferredoxin
VTSHWTQAGLSQRLKREAFVRDADDADDAAPRAASAISFRRSARTVESAAPTLLAIAESAGIRPATGCRMGICRTCTCRKIAGATRDLRTGEISTEDNVDIQLCVNAPVGPVSLDL